MRLPLSALTLVSCPRCTAAGWRRVAVLRPQRLLTLWLLLLGSPACDDGAAPPAASSPGPPDAGDAGPGETGPPACHVPAGSTPCGEGVCAEAVARCVDGEWLCAYPADHEPGGETLLDGRDNDCDGQTDEDLVNACGQPGLPPEEVCNGEDDDCDGQVDEGAPGDGEACDTGVPGECARGIGDCTAGVFSCEQQVEASAEECDGLDNDCDGQTDNGLQGPTGEELHQPCIAGVGACEEAGVIVCTADGLGVECNAEPGEPAERDRCGNDVDDDCDGRVDEWEGGEEESRECVVGIGECQRRGQWDCDEETGEHTVCSVEPGEARAEVCGNGLDEDCDGTPDQDCSCDPTVPDPDNPGGTVPETQPCYTGDPGTQDVRPCHVGTQTCQADGTWGAACEGEVVPVVESCNGVDDDCDGAPDDGLEPPPANRQDGVCAGVRQVCGGQAGWQEPDYGALDDYEAAESTCDGLDNDCDRDTDETLEEAPLADVRVGVCDGVRKVCGGDRGWVEPDYEGIEGYEAEEASCDGLDNDCDERTDEDLVAPLADWQDGVCDGTLRVCDGEAGWVEPDYSSDVPDYEEVEATLDGLDNDCDGLTDEGFGVVQFWSRVETSPIRVNAGERLALVGEDFTMEAWVYATDFPAADANAIISRRSHVTGKGYLFGVTTGGAPPGWRVMFLADDFPQAEQAGRLVVGEHEDLEDDRWYHVAVTFEHLAGPPSSRRVALFLDGHLVAVAPDFPQELSEWQPNAATWIGGDDINANDDQPHRRYSYNFAGRIADVRVTTGIRYPLDPGCEQVGQAPCCQDCFGDQLQACLASDDDVIAYWPLNEGDGCTVHDLGPDGLLNSEDPPALNAVVGANPDACADRWLQGQEHACSQRLPPAGDGG